MGFRPRAAEPVAVLLLVVAAAAPVLAGRAGEVRVRSFELLNEGVAAYNRGDHAEAVHKLDESASMALNSFRAHYYLGLARIGHRDYARAVEALAIALDLDPTHLQALVALGDAHLKRGEIGESRAAYQRALKIRPAFPPALDGLARSYEAQANDDTAIRHYRDAIASNKGFAPAYTHLGDLYLRSGELELAVELLEEAIDIRPDYAPGLNRLALAYGRLGLHNEAIATIQRAIDLQPSDPMHWVTRGRLELSRGFVGGAERSFRHALDLERGMPEARAGLGGVAYRQGDYARALDEFDAALDDPRLDASYRRRLAEFRDAVAVEADEVAGLERSIRQGTALTADYARLAELCAKRGMWELAADLQRHAGTGRDARERLAYVLFKARRYRESHALYAELAAETGELELRVNTGLALARLGDDEGAADLFRAVLDADPAHRPAWIYLGNAMLRLGRRDEAAEAYGESLRRGDGDEAAERVRRILLQIAPERIPADEEPPPPRVADRRPA